MYRALCLGAHPSPVSDYMRMSYLFIVLFDTVSLKKQKCFSQNPVLKDLLWAGKMAEWVKVLGAKPNDLSSIPGLYMVGGEDLVAPHSRPGMWVLFHLQISK